MCTALTLEMKDFYFGRNMDIEYSFGERIVVVPREYSLKFKKMPEIKTHYALFGMAAVVNDTPLFAEAVNEKGVCVAGLNFPEFARYEKEEVEGKLNIAPYEIIPFLLSQCENVDDAVLLIKDLNIMEIPFEKNIPISYLHFIVSDKNKSVVLEQTADGLKVFDNPYGVLTNNPPFDFHLNNVRQYMRISPLQPTNCIAPKLNVKPFSQGFGGLGLPGDFTPASRFVKTVFLKYNSVCDDNENSSVAQFFHILDGVAFVRGAVVTPSNQNDITLYSCCVNVSKFVYYYKTYDNNQICAVIMNEENMNGSEIFVYELEKSQNINFLN